MDYFWKKKSVVGYYLSIFVVLIHISTVFNYQFTQQKTAYTLYQIFDVVMRNTFTLCAVPLFLIISGVCFFRDYSNQKYLSKIKNRIRSLLIPYLLWNIINMIFEIAVTRSFLSRFLVGRSPFVFSASNILLSVFWYKTNSVFWFMFDLIVFSLAAPIIWLFVRNKVTALITTVALIALNLAGIGLPEAVFFRSDALIYFFIGAVIGTHFFPLFTQKKDTKTAILALGLVVICTGIQIVNKLKIFPLTDPVNTPILVVFALAVWFTADLFIDRLKTVPPRYQNSFMIYALNQNVEAVIVKVLYLVMPKNQWFAFPNFIFTVILTVMVINLVSQLLRRYFPIINQMLTGAR